MKTKINIFQFPFYLLLVMTSYQFLNAIQTYMQVQKVQSSVGGISVYAYFMVLIVFSSYLVILSELFRRKTLPKIILVSIGFVFICILSTTISGLYPFTRLPFQFLYMSYWVCVLILVYYSPFPKNINIPVYVIIAVLPIFFLSYLNVVNANIFIINGFLLLNNVYYILFLLPFLLILKSQIIRNIGILIIFAAVVISFKRTAIISLILSLVFFFLINRQLLKAKKSRILTYIFVSILVIFGGIYIYYKLSQLYNLDWAQRLIALATDKGGNRADIWRDISLALTKQDYISWFIGNGYLADASMGAAHNDFLEILYDFGIIGLIIYSWFNILLINYFFKMKKSKYQYYPAFGASLIMFFICSLFSQLVIYPYWFIYLPMFWGLLISNYERYEEIIIEKKRSNLIGGNIYRPVR